MEFEERPSKIRKLSHEEGQNNAIDVDDADEPTTFKPNGSTIEEKPQHEESDEDSVRISLDLQSIPSELSHRSDAEHVSTDPSKIAITGNDDEKLPAPIDIAPLADCESQQGMPALSKSQQKKLRKKAEWESQRESRKVIRKEKQVAKRERKRAARQQESEQATGQAEERPEPQKAVQLPITILIDCDFDDLMRDHERVSLSAQITRSYSDNKNSRFRAHLTMCSFGGKLRERFDNILDHYKSWRGVRTLDCDFVEAAEEAKEWMLSEKGGQLAGAFSKYAELDTDAHAELKNAGELVYLTSEGDEDLLELKPYSTYIIGGLVDKNREKGICYKRAKARGVKTARLPIGEYMDMQSRKILATNHVNQIMVKWLECSDWGEAFLEAIPKRKGGKLKDAAEEVEMTADGKVQ